MRFFLKAVALAAILSPAYAASEPKPLFSSVGAIGLTVSGPLRSLSREKDSKPASGSLIVTGQAPETLPILLSSRGVTRRRKDVCAFPPLRVEFSQKPPKGSLFEGQKHLKLVTHCQPGEKFTQDVLLEYAAYRLYQALTPESFSVRLAKITYLDGNGSEMFTRPGFFIEDVDDVARRNGQKRLHMNGQITAYQLDPTAATRFTIFQYMISNLDWSMTTPEAGEDCCHNARLLDAPSAATGVIPAPYDFDMSGLVEPPYAGVPQIGHVNSIRERRYRGFCVHNAQLLPVAAEFSTRRATMMAVFDQIPDLNPNTRARAVSYLNEFFDEIASPAKLIQIQGYCVN